MQAIVGEPLRSRVVRFFTDDLPQPARNYLTAITVVGLLIAVFSYIRVILGGEGQWLYLALLTAVAAFLPVRLRFSGDQILSVSFTISDVFIFSGLLFFPPEVAVAVGVIDATLVSFQFLHRSRMYRFLFNVAQVSTSIFLVGNLFYLIQGHMPPLTSQDSGLQTFINVGICGFLYVVLNVTAVATALFLSSPEAGTEVWRASIVPSAFSTLARRSGDETILLVEDEDKIRALISEILRRKGYTVFEAADGEKALPLAKRLGAFDLLITDLVMPVMGGWELARELRKTRDRKALRVLYISGYPDTIHPELLKGGSQGVAFLAKPFTPDALLRKVREILSPSRDA